MPRRPSSSLLRAKVEKEERGKRRKNLARAIELTWGSLRTHLADAIEAEEDTDTRGNERWNARCVREYGEVIYTLSVELHELAKKDFPADYEDLKKAIPA